MTKWKDEIDRALGQDVKFNEDLQREILKQAVRRRINWQYPLTALAFVCVAVLLFFIGPTQKEREVTANLPFEQLIEQAQVERFFISSTYSETEQFFARASSRYTRIHAFEEIKDTAAMNDFLHAMMLVENPQSLWGGNDLLIEMSNGEQIKLKVMRENASYLVLDVYSKLTYQVARTDAVYYQKLYLQMSQSVLSFGWILVILGSVIVLAIIQDKLLNNQKFVWKHQWSWKSFLMSFAVIIAINFLSNYLRTHEYVLHKDVLFTFFAVFIFSLQLITQRKQTSIKKRWIGWSMYVMILLLLWIILNYG